MTLRITFGDKQAGANFKRGMQRVGERMRRAIEATANEAAAEVQKRGRIDIIQAGNFGDRWIQGFTATVSQGGGFYRIRVEEAVVYWRVFQYGNVTQGNPLLWIPLSFADDAQGVRARDYPGQLFRVDRVGKAPLLMAPGGEPKYFGKESVTIPKKFHLLEIAAEVSREIPAMYHRNFKKAK